MNRLNEMTLRRAISATLKAEEAEEQSKRYCDAAADAEKKRWQATDALAQECGLDADHKGMPILFKHNGTIYECYFDRDAPRASWILREAEIIF